MTYSANLWLRRGLKQIFNPHQKISNDMWHATCMHVIQGDSRLLVVENQIDTLILNLFIGHNLCCKYSNGSCEPILDIYVSKYFQWYQELFNLMSFDLSNHSLKIWKSIKTPTSKVKVHLGMCEPILSHSLALMGVWMWLLGYIIDPHFCMVLP
jgi:hypothetical protein